MIVGFSISATALFILLMKTGILPGILYMGKDFQEWYDEHISKKTMTQSPWMLSLYSTMDWKIPFIANIPLSILAFAQYGPMYFEFINLGIVYFLWGWAGNGNKLIQDIATGVIDRIRGRYMNTPADVLTDGKRIVDTLIQGTQLDDLQYVKQFIDEYGNDIEEEMGKVHGTLKSR